MAQRRTTNRNARGRKSSTETSVRVDRENSREDRSLLDRLQTDLTQNQSYLNLILGALIVVVLGILLFNYFTRQDSDLGPAQQTTSPPAGDVTKENLPGKYTVKENDTLFTIAQKYYDDGYQYNLIVAANSLTNENTLEVGQVLEIPKPQVAAEDPSPYASPAPATMDAGEKGTGGAVNQTVWGDKITSDTYTVQPGDWLSKISGRAYGDIYAYQRIAQANNISDPNTIEVGMVFKIPR